MKFVVVFGIVAGTYGLIRLGLYFGYRWVDKMLCVPEPIDLNKPIVRPLPRSP
jgi:hypothetical protein